MSSIAKHLVILLFSLLLLGGCSSSAPKEPPSQIAAFEYRSTAPESQVSPIRLAAIQETAASLGAQGGLAWASQQINNMLSRNERELNESFNFRQLLLDNNVLPPVLTQGDRTLHIDNPDALRLADKVYKIETPPRFVTAPPTWRQYLWMTYQRPERPNASLIPKNDEEREVWNRYVAIGWKEGVQQADQIFTANLGRLKRDYNGMITYRVLLAQNMVTPPFVAKSDLGITGDEHEMRVNDQVLRITSTSKLIPNSKEWRSVITPGTEGAIRKQGTEGTEELE